MRNHTKSPEISRLIEFMRLNKMKPADLAASISIPERTLTNFIWNNRPLSGNVLRQLHAVHGVSIDWMVSGAGDMFGFSGHRDEIAESGTEPEAIEPLLPFFETVDDRKLGDYWWMAARSTEQSLIQSGAVPGRDYSIMDLYRLARPFVLERFKSEGLNLIPTENIF